VEGNAEIDLQLTPRPEYGICRPLLYPTPGGVVARGGPDTISLASP